MEQPPDHEPLNRLKGASDAAGITEENCFHLGEILFLLTATVICHDFCLS